MSSDKRRRYAGRALTIVLALILAVFNVPFPVRTVVPALEIKLDDPSYGVACEIAISGYYHINVCKENAFRGQISVSNYWETTAKMVSPIYLDPEGCPLEYRDARKEDSSSLRAQQYDYTLGYLYTKPFMRAPILNVLSNNPLHKDAGAIKRGEEGNWGNWSEEDGFCIVPYAKNREEAISTLVKRGIIHP